MTHIKELKDYVYIPNAIERGIPIDDQTRKIQEALRRGCSIEDYRKVEIAGSREQGILGWQTTAKKGGAWGGGMEYLLGSGGSEGS